MLKLLITVAILLFSWGCQTTVVYPPVQPEDLNPLKSFQPQTIQLDYQATGKIQFRKNRKNQSASCQILLTADHRLQFKLFHPITGDIAEAYVDQDKIIILDHTNHVFYDLTNTRKNRDKIPALMNLDTKILQVALWGREQPELQNKVKTTYLNGHPKQLQVLDNHSGMVIKYTKWLDHKGVAIPKIVHIESRSKKSKIKLVVTKFDPVKGVQMKSPEIPSEYSWKE